MKTKIDYTKFICPINKKHAMRESTSKHYCDVWCDTCKEGWKISELSTPKEEINRELLVVNENDYNYKYIYLSISPSLKATLLAMRSALTGMDSRCQITSPVDKLNIGKAISEIEFENDLTDSYKEKIEDEIFSKSFFKVSDLDKKIDLKNSNFDELSSFRAESCKLKVSAAGISISCANEDIKTAVVPWRLIE